MRIDPATSEFLQHYFDKIIVITLARATQRHEQVTRQLEGLPFEFFYGTDKQQLDRDQLIKDNVYNDARAKEINRYGKGMILGHIACALSHRSVYQYVLDKGYQRVMIFEDDVVPFPERLPGLKDAILELPPDWEMVYFGYQKYERATPQLKVKQAFYKVLSHLRLLRWSPRMVSNLLPRPYSQRLQRAGFHDLLHAYAVTNKACRTLVAAQTPVVLNSDPLVTYVIMNGNLNAFSTYTQFFTQEMYLDPAHRSFIHHL